MCIRDSYSTPFWGSIDKRVSERQRETKYGVDLSMNLEMGKFLPEASNVRIPMFVGYSEQVSNPQFDPLNPDIEWDDATRSLTREERRERLKQSRTYTRRRSLNFTNVRKDRGQDAGDERPWDVENLSLSYSYTDQEYFDVNTAFENTRTYRGSIAYLHSPKPRPIEPFKEIGFISTSKWLKLFKDFNVNLGFKQVSMRTSIDRQYLERLVRANPNIESLPPTPTYNKNFNWISQYGFKYELTRALKLDFNANNLAVIGETPGRVNPRYEDEYALWKDSVLASVRGFGEVTRYDHTIALTYTLPFDKLPFTDWITSNVSYTAGYQWDRAPFTQDTPVSYTHLIQTRTLAGARFDYKVSRDLVIGGTVMNLYERPLTQKVNVGDEPIANTILGLDANWQTGSQWLTQLVDRLPFYATKQESSVTGSIEGAYLIPGHSRAIGDAGTSYIDDFEGSVSTIDLRTQSLWFHASTPQGIPTLFPEGGLVNDLGAGYRRALISWYVIDPLFFRQNDLTPDHIRNDPEMRGDNRMREVLEREVFPFRQLPAGTPNNIPVLDITYYPEERGPYNYETSGARVGDDGNFTDPENNWGGMMRRITTTDFESSNIESIQFWVMDPFQEGVFGASNEDSQNSTGGYLYIDLGNLSEDVLRDGRKAFENGLPKDPEDGAADIDFTAWGLSLIHI